jgi:hypothetical protein
MTQAGSQWWPAGEVVRRRTGSALGEVQHAGHQRGAAGGQAPFVGHWHAVDSVLGIAGSDAAICAAATGITDQGNRNAADSAVRRAAGQHRAAFAGGVADSDDAFGHVITTRQEGFGAEGLHNAKAALGALHRL